MKRQKPTHVAAQLGGVVGGAQKDVACAGMAAVVH